MKCTPLVLPGGVKAIICGPRPRRRRCQTRGCYRMGEVLCDHPMGNGKTCDAWMCREHRTNVGPDRDLCPAHAGQGELFRESGYSDPSKPPPPSDDEPPRE